MICPWPVSFDACENHQIHLQPPSSPGSTFGLGPRPRARYPLVVVVTQPGAATDAEEEALEENQIVRIWRRRICWQLILNKDTCRLQIFKNQKFIFSKFPKNKLFDKISKETDLYFFDFALGCYYELLSTITNCFKKNSTLIIIFLCVTPTGLRSSHCASERRGVSSRLSHHCSLHTHCH